MNLHISPHEIRRKFILWNFIFFFFVGITCETRLYIENYRHNFKIIPDYSSWGSDDYCCGAREINGGPKLHEEWIKPRKERIMLWKGEGKKTGGVCSVRYDNLKLFDGINKKTPNARILPWPSHRLQNWVCVWKLLYNSFSTMRFSSIAGFLY